MGCAAGHGVPRQRLRERDHAAQPTQRAHASLLAGELTVRSVQELIASRLASCGDSLKRARDPAAKSHASPTSLEILLWPRGGASAGTISRFAEDGTKCGFRFCGCRSANCFRAVTHLESERRRGAGAFDEAGMRCSNFLWLCVVCRTGPLRGTAGAPALLCPTVQQITPLP